jgi:hypothetical protein
MCLCIYMFTTTMHLYLNILIRMYTGVLILLRSSIENVISFMTIHRASASIQHSGMFIYILVCTYFCEHILRYT